MDLGVVEERYAELRAALPDVDLHYAVKANPYPPVIDTLLRLGARWDVASSQEMDLCLSRGAAPGSISYGSTIKTASAVRDAAARGVRLFAFDSQAELEKIAVCAPGSSVFCRLANPGTSALVPLSAKFGCPADLAADLLRQARRLGLTPAGVSFHVGSQQLDPSAWKHGIRLAANVYREVAAFVDRPWLLNLGGGFPAGYGSRPASVSEIGTTIRSALNDAFGGVPIWLMAEPGRFLVAEAGVIRSSVILVAFREFDRRARRWVYLDVGRFNGGLVELEDGIMYPITAYRAGPRGPAVLAGPTCDSTDVLSQQHMHQLPISLREGDYIDIGSTGAYTASFASTAFNGFPPITVHAVPSSS